MKKYFAIALLAAGMTFGLASTSMAQDEEEAAATEQVEATDEESAVDEATEETAPAAAEEPAAEEESESMHQVLKTKFIEGSAGFMSLVAVALVLGLALCIERVIYLSLSEIPTKKFMEAIEAKLNARDVDGALKLCRDTRGPVASICYQGLMQLGQGLEEVERSVTAYGAVQASKLERNCSWITLFIAMAPSLGFLGTVIGMVEAFDRIERAGDISPTVVAGGMKIALITTIFGIVVALILQVFYNYILAKIEDITSKMEESSIDLLDMCAKFVIK